MLRTFIMHVLKSLFRIFLTLALIPLSPAANSAELPPAQVLLTTPDLTPESRFEVRFLVDMIEPHQVGMIPDAPPIIIEPALAGRFTWHSLRSGLFEPTEPFQLGTRLRFSLSPNTVDRNGKTLPTSHIRTIDVPPLSARWEPRSYLNHDDLPLEPALSLISNGAIDHLSIVDRVFFKNDTFTIPARIVPVDPPENFSTRPRNRLTWTEQFERQSNPTVPKAPREILANEFHIRPSRPLPPGTNWYVELDKGIASSEAIAPMPTGASFRLGTVQPFVVTHIEPRNSLESGRQILIHFSRTLAEATPDAPLQNWIHIVPEPQNLALTTHGRSVTVQGEFEFNTPYNVAVEAGLPGKEPVHVREDTATSIQFHPLRPTVWLPTFTGVQLDGGHRSWPILHINTPVVRLRLKQLDEHGLIHTHRAYQRYMRGIWGNLPRGFLPTLDFNGVAGRTVLTTNLISSVQPPDTVQTNLLHWDNLVGNQRSGAWFVDTELLSSESDSNPQPGPQAIVQLTDLAIVTKTSHDEMRVWIHSHRTGLPKPNISVSLRSAENEILASGTTDNSGEVILPPSAHTTWILAQDGVHDIHAFEYSDGVVWPFYYGLPWSDTDQAAVRLFAFTDREAVRPGDTLHFKLLARQRSSEGWIFPDVTNVIVRLHDPIGDTLETLTLPLSEAGSVHGTLRIPVGRRGTHDLSFEIGDAAIRKSIEVRDLRPATFTLAIEGQRTIAPDDPLRLIVNAHLPWGQPIETGALRWTLNSSDAAFDPEGWDDFNFFNQESHRHNRHRHEIQTGAPPGSNAEQGSVENKTPAEWRIEAQLPIHPDYPRPRLGSLRAELTDINQQTLATSANITRHASDFYIGFAWADGAETVLAADTPAAFHLVAVTPEGLPTTEPATVEMVLQRIHWRSVRVLGAGGGLEYRNEPEIENLIQQTLTTQTANRHGPQWRVDAPPIPFPPLNEPGDYRVEFRSRDGSDRSVVTSVDFSVAGSGRLAWNHRNGGKLELVPDRSNYSPGQVARILVKSPFDGTARITVEGDRVHQVITHRLSGNAPLIDIPIESTHSPAVYISVLLLRGHADSPRQNPEPEWRLGYTVINVQSPDAKLAVDVTPAETSILPGSPIHVTLTVRDATGTPVSGSDVTFYAVDESHLTLMATDVPDPFNVFAKPSPLTVATSLSLPLILTESPELRSFGNKGRPGGDGGKTKAIRSNFIPTPFWEGQLTTDANGTVSVTFKAPDSLTRYRLVAVATHQAHRFGSGSSTVSVEKSLMIDPALPSFAHVGDQIHARAIVFNQTDQSHDIQVQLKFIRDLPGEIADVQHVSTSADKSLSENPSSPPQNHPTNHPTNPLPYVAAKYLTIQPGERLPVDFPIDIISPGNSVAIWSVETTDTTPSIADLVESRVVVSHGEPDLREVLSFQHRGGRRNLTDSLHPQWALAEGHITLRIASTPMALVGEGMHHLLSYPYGCAEQTASSLLPWLVLDSIPDDIAKYRHNPRHGTATAGSVGILPAHPITVGIERLWSMQLGSGALGYWPGSNDAHRWASAYGALVLAIAIDKSHPVSASRIDQLLTWLDLQCRIESPPWTSEQRHVRSLTALAMAFSNRDTPGLEEDLIADWELLRPDDRAFLTLAVHRRGGNMERLRQVALRHAESDQGTSTSLYGSESRTRALRLLAESILNTDPTASQRRLSELLGARQAGHWQTTQANAWSLWALHHLANKSPHISSSPITLHFGEQTQTVQTSPDQPWVLATFPFSTKSAAPKELIIESPEGSSVWIETTVKGRIPATPKPALARNNGIGVTRTYSRLDTSNAQHPFETLRIGDRVLVQLKIDSPQNIDWLAIDDPLPSVFEALEGVFVTEASALPRFATDASADFTEVQLDRVRFFKNHLSPGQHTFSYVARVRASGNVLIGPARAEAMYDPNRHGQSTGLRIAVDPQ